MVLFFLLKGVVIDERVLQEVTVADYGFQGARIFIAKLAPEIFLEKGASFDQWRLDLPHKHRRRK